MTENNERRVVRRFGEGEYDEDIFVVQRYLSSQRMWVDTDEDPRSIQ